MTTSIAASPFLSSRSGILLNSAAVPASRNGWMKATYLGTNGLAPKSDVAQAEENGRAVIESRHHSPALALTARHTNTSRHAKVAMIRSLSGGEPSSVLKNIS